MEKDGHLGISVRGGANATMAPRSGAPTVAAPPRRPPPPYHIASASAKMPIALSVPRDGSDGIKLTNRTTRSFAAQVVVAESALSGSIQAGPQAFHGAFYKNCAFAREHTIRTTAQLALSRAELGPRRCLETPIRKKNKLVPQGRDQVAKLPLFVRTQTHSLGKSQ